MAKIYKHISFLLMFFMLHSCVISKWQVESIKGVKIPVDKSLESIQDTSFVSELKPYKYQLDLIMNEVIGFAEVNMSAHKPESLLSNLSSDIYKKRASELMGEDVDIAISNMGGLRTQIPMGPITVGRIYQLLPFENELVMLWIKGNDLKELTELFAKMGGQGVSGLQMGIRQGNPENVLINGKPLDINKIYSIATNDFLALGGDMMVQLTRHVKKRNTGLTVRQVFIDYLKSENARGNKIHPVLENRIYKMND